MEPKKYSLLFVYAFFKSEGEEGVHEDLCTNTTIKEGVSHAKKIWQDADEYRVSDIQLGSPYFFLFAKDRSPAEISKYVVDMDINEISNLVDYLNKFNEPPK